MFRNDCHKAAVRGFGVDRGDSACWDSFILGISGICLGWLMMLPFSGLFVNRP